MGFGAATGCSLVAVLGCDIQDKLGGTVLDGAPWSPPNGAWSSQGPWGEANDTNQCARCPAAPTHKPAPEPASHTLASPYLWPLDTAHRCGRHKTLAAPGPRPQAADKLSTLPVSQLALIPSLLSSLNRPLLRRRRLSPFFAILPDVCCARARKLPQSWCVPTASPVLSPPHHRPIRRWGTCVQQPR